MTAASGPPGKRASVRLERLGRLGLIRVHLTGLDVGDIKVFSARGAAGHSAQHGQLAHMGQRIGHGARRGPSEARNESRLRSEEKNRCCSSAQARGCVTCQCSCPRAALSAQSKRSPM